ncbi:MAG TPA: hypothetical protein PLP56_02125 [Candidatus Omnitrophota bacterium]|nr:hypothetical protein [Candidatus Omnitrophota bacterium]HNQ49926.1 hypothetical protein [Candidatus Omnitrophota bacterium]HQO37318.1 hypothetical protein [Candidatus Omnitrophota bacterium]HQQ05763.1 hypothetical protein [Candidatus Omnitrophota bacterium]
MKALKRARARALRAQGWSIREISLKIHCAKSSVSGWVSDIPLTSAQIDRLDSKQDRGRAKAANHPNSPKAVWYRFREDIKRRAAREIPIQCSAAMLRVLGAGLYWAEGYKRSEAIVNFSNSDPAMIALMMKFFRTICKVPETKFRGVVHIHPHLNRCAAVKFWSRLSKIPVKQFHQVQLCVSRASKQKRDTLPLGTFRIIICDVKLQSRIKGWIKGIERWSNMGAVSSAG